MSPTVDKKLLPMKAHYFLFNAGTAPVVPFMPTLIRQLGFSPVIVGTIYTVLPVVGMLVKPLFGMLADKFQRQKLFFLLFQILTAVSFFLIMFIPPIPQEQKLDFHCHNGASNLKYCPPEGAFLDKCITDTLTTDNSTDLLMCELTCDADPWMWDYICQNWNVSQFCNESNKITDKSKLLFTTITPMKNIELVGQCLFFQVHRAEFGGQVVELNCPANATDFKSKCDAVCDNPQVMDVITKSKIENDEVSSLYQFWLIFILLILSWAGMAVVVSVGDAICFEMLGDKPQLYGNQRLWGAIGWGVFSLLAGFLVDRFSTGGTTKNYSVVFYMALIIISFDMIVSTRLKHSQSKFSTNIFKDVGRIFRSARVLMFFLWCILVGFGTALIWNFLFWHLENLADAQEGCNRLDWMKTLQGLAMIVQCFGGELPFFFLSGKILKKIGHIHAMSLVLLGFGIRFLCYSFLVNPWWVIPIEFTQGITFGVFYSTMASYASIVAPPGTEATLQGLVGAVFEGIGVSFGSLFGGILFNKIGGSLTFRYFGIAAICFFVIHVLVQYVMEKMFGSHGKKNKITKNGTNDHTNNIEINTVTSTSSITASVKENVVNGTEEKGLVNGNGKLDTFDDFKEIDLNRTE